jgi:hypothetical protein
MYGYAVVGAQTRPVNDATDGYQVAKYEFRFCVPNKLTPEQITKAMMAFAVEVGAVEEMDALTLTVAETEFEVPVEAGL